MRISRGNAYLIHNGVLQILDFCAIQRGNKTFTKTANECIIPKVVAKYLLRVGEFGDWAKKHWKGEQAVKGILVDTRSKKSPDFIDPILRMNLVINCVLYKLS